MKTAVVYGSKTGASAKCARELYMLLPDSELFNIDIDKVDIPKYDNIIVGGGIRMSRLPKKIRKFLSANTLELSKKNLGFFICCSFPEQKDTYFVNNIPPILYKKAISCECFGCEMDIASMKGFDRFICRLVMKTEGDRIKDSTKINTQAIDLFAKKFL